MTRNFAYDVNAGWDDPFETREERRINSRTGSRFEASMAAPAQGRRGRYVGPALVRDISLEGALVLTKHQLWEGQIVTLTIPTAFCPDTLGLPASFTGTAKVERLRPFEGKRVEAALRFGEDFSRNMDFAVFVEFVQSVSRVMTT